MKEKGLESWNQTQGKASQPDRHIEENTERFFVDALAQPYAPKRGKAAEFGCGTGPMLRWLNDRGFSGLGIDISTSAIEMARAQSPRRDLQFRQGNVCSNRIGVARSFDLVLDGNCLHCLTDPHDRSDFLRNAFRLLKSGGVFLVSTMAGPVDLPVFKGLFPDQVLRKCTIFVPTSNPSGFEDCRRIDGKWMLPTRCIEPWERIIRMVETAGFEVKLIRFHKPHGDVPTGYLNLVARKP